MLYKWSVYERRTFHYVDLEDASTMIKLPVYEAKVMQNN